MQKQALLSLIVFAAACGGHPPKSTMPDHAVEARPDEPAPKNMTPPVDPRIAQASAFLTRVDGELRKVFVAGSLAEWAYETDITDAHEAAASAANNEQNIAITRLVKEARTYEPIIGKLSPIEQRELHVLIYMTGQPAPDDPKLAKDLADIEAKMVAAYGGGEVCGPKDPIDPKTKKPKCKDIEEVSKVLQKTRKPAEALAAWQGWHDTVGHAERDLFVKYVGLANQGARAIGFKDVGDEWKSGYDMSPDQFAAETDRLWGQVKPLYEQLHCYTRRKLNTMYGDKVVAKSGPIPAHLLGNIWAQSWGYLYPELEPYKGQAKIDVTPTLEKKFTDKSMVQMPRASTRRSG